MPIEILSAPAAVETIRANAYSAWPARGENETRLQPFAKPAFRPSFQLEAGEAIFTIGSCFARNIELGLEARGFDLPTQSFFRSNSEFATLGRNILNNYGAPSILNELSWALDPRDSYSEEYGFCEIYPGRFVDLHLNHAIPPSSLDIVRRRRAAINGIYNEIKRCRIAIFTLGLAEVWFDNDSRRYINTTPRRTMIRNTPDRFELHVLDYDETRDFLQRTFALIQDHCRPDIRVLLTVSPVPLTATYRSVDVMSANTYSKSVLRAAAEEMTYRFDFIDYYPSYESITLSERQVAWLEDQIHPTPEAIDLNCSRMIAGYTQEASSIVTVEEIRLRIAEKRELGAVFGLLDNRRDLIEAHSDLAVSYCEGALRARRAQDADWAFPFTDGSLEAAERNLLGARIALAMGRPADAIALLDVCPQARVLKNLFYASLMQARAATGDLDGARETARQWVAVNNRTPEPFRILGVSFSLAGDTARADTYFRQALDLSDDQPSILLDYVEHLERTGRMAEARAFLEHIDPKNPSHEARLERLRLDI